MITLKSLRPYPLGQYPRLPQCPNFSKDGDYKPFAPLITAKTINNGSQILTRVTLLVDARVDGFAIPEGQITDNKLTYTFKYTLPDLNAPTAIIVWYTELVEDFKAGISVVEVKLQDRDPETSRGTETTVQGGG